MKKYFVLFIGLLLAGFLPGAIISVDIEGNGDYTTIQEGINASSNDDTVLVYLGRYYENIDFIGKTITVASLEMTTGNRDYIHSTIIDGNQTGSCVAVHNNEGEGTSLRGFTITNGIGFLDGSRRYGGGIYLFEVSISIINCIVEYNEARVGGGIEIGGCTIFLEGTTIRFNQAQIRGGGLSSWNQTNSLCFSDSNRCNIYDNFALYGFDIFNCTETGIGTDVIVDTFTVSEPWGYEFYQGDGDFIQDYQSTVFDVQHFKYERVATDLYVSPAGDDSNIGNSIEEPLQTINHALRIITADEENPRTIYLANGTYSTILNNQQFPINMRSYVSIIGESRDNTILDLGIGHQGFVIDLISEMNYEFKNFTVQNAWVNEDDTSWLQGFYLSNRLNYDGEIVLENIKMENNDISPLVFAGNMNIILRNIEYNNNNIDTNCVTFRYTKRGNAESFALVENCQIKNFEGGIFYLSSNDDLMPEDLTIDILSCEFSNHVYHNQSTPHYTRGLSVFGFGGMNLNIINNTFTENHLFGPSIGSAPLRVAYGMEVELINNIIYNNSSHSVIIEGNSEYMPVVTMHHNIIENGLDGLLTNGSYILNWDDETNWDFDPMFFGEGAYPYSLQAGSPAIDAGTLELPVGVELPEFDLAGNPRIMGSGIDLGAYEYNPYSNPVIVEELEYSTLIIYPNPMHLNQGRGSVTINYLTDKIEAEYELSIYNIKGQRLRKLKIENVISKMNTINWDCCDSDGEKVTAGVYFLRITKDGKFIDQGKLTVIK
jgi:hypothetical protein